ncbi:uncharacterized protein HMPREF1541_02224 [Cyphellophora europaea CBS 101466]|uniref:Uncharacterized protein n=1 Tax=Cyphellophora europaea (strain CBS 101466) TaxID=1220924 RepID=W2S2X4_CYPE1|nr:uncharacterized protein HMPREF1541_02224 [Cyphellophora europaea CBS 101466]ETN43066.1 hypothetical protein HMPREF1541_02224 [Cyphellophora europaea CBS 101466]
MTKDLSFLPVSLLALVARVAGAQLPYTPTSILASDNGSIAYLFAPQPDSSLCTLSLYNVTDTLDISSKPTTLLEELPFLSSSTSKPFLPLVDEEGVTVLTGDCAKGAEGTEIWRYTPNDAYTEGSWSQLKVAADQHGISANYLSAGLAFPATDNMASTLYIFGGMCPNSSTSTNENWVSNANYSSTMLAMTPQSPSDAESPYQISTTGLRAPPIPEAGLSMTPLVPAFADAGEPSQQQNFVLIGGHTQNAFINMSQVALFTLPQASWAFIPVNQPGSKENTELLRRSADFVEPRSGHTAVLTQDGSKIIVVGGWVGSVDTPAEPQVAVLNIGQGYGGSGDWTWSVPESPGPFAPNGGIYGHGATLLQGGIMVIAGGININGGVSKLKRQTASNFHFLNTTSMQWTDSYTHPASPSAPNAHTEAGSAGLQRSDKIGIGTGIGLSIAALALVVSVWFWYTRRLRKQRNMREKELRNLALGAERQFDPAIVGFPDEKYPERRTASWANMQERALGTFGGGTLPWKTSATHEGNGLRQAERTGASMEVPSPTRGLRRSLHSRGPGSGGVFQPAGAPGAVFRIDEEEENSQSGSLRKTRTPKNAADRSSQYSDPFKDPPPTADSNDPAAEQRRREVQGWVDDWQSAASSILSRNPSQAQTNRTYSNLSQAHSYMQTNQNSSSSGGPSGRGSPEKSDRTGSNLSERSAYSQLSFQRSVNGTVSRNQSQRSASAGYTIFSGAAAAMGRLGLSRNQQQPDSAGSGISRETSKRSVSMREYGSAGPAPSMRERADTFSSMRSAVGAIQPGEDHALLGRLNTRPGTADDHSKPPVSPVKDREGKYGRASSLTRTGAMAMGLLGSVKRVITGTGGVSVHERVAALEHTSPTKSAKDESPQRRLSPSQEFWRGQRGAQDWKVVAGEMGAEGASQSRTIRRKPVPSPAQQDEGDWDVESAVQNRVVQVMFTVPKEKLRVVNADALSLLSSNKSDVDHDEEKEREKEVKRMSSVREADEADTGWKGKEPDRG